MDGISQFLETLERFQLVIYPVLMGIFAWGWTLWNKLKAKRDELIASDKEKLAKKNKELLAKWEHEASLEVICNIKQLCNLYKDRSSAERVSYGQLENGTIAASELCNMFISWLAEDDRYGKLSKQVRHLQRIQYSELVNWIEAIRKADKVPDKGYMEVTSKTKNLLDTINRVYKSPIGSQLGIIVNDPAGIFIGFCLFDYANDMFNNIDIEQEVKLLKNFKVAIESTIYNYNVQKESKRQELGVD